MHIVDLLGVILFLYLLHTVLFLPAFFFFSIFVFRFSFGLNCNDVSPFSLCQCNVLLDMFLIHTYTFSLFLSYPLPLSIIFFLSFTSPPFSFSLTHICTLSLSLIHTLSFFLILTHYLSHSHSLYLPSLVLNTLPFFLPICCPPGLSIFFSAFSQLTQFVTQHDYCFNAVIKKIIF